MVLSEPLNVLLIDGNHTDRIGFATHLKKCSPNYRIYMATDGRSGLALYRSRRIDCVVLALDLPDGFELLVELVPIARQPSVPVVALTDSKTRSVQEIATSNGAHACLVRHFTSGVDLHRAIQQAISNVRQVPKEITPVPSRRAPIDHSTSPQTNQ